MNANTQANVKSKPAELSLADLKAQSGGLGQDEAQRRLAQYGPNALGDKREGTLLNFLGYSWGPIPWMIEFAAVLCAVVGHWVDLTIVLILLAFNAVVGFWQEHQAAKLVPGDVVRLRLGDIIPADVRLIEGDYLSVDQSALTGESLPVDKKSGEVAYSSSVAKQGEMVALVSGTGANTFFGKTAKLVSTAKSVSHFQKAVLTIGDYLIYVSLGLAALLLLTMFSRGGTHPLAAMNGPTKANL